VLVVSIVLVESRHVLLLVTIATLLAIGLEPVTGWLRGLTHLSRGATILIVYALFLAAVVGLMFVIVPSAIDQLTELSTRLPELLDNARAWAESLGPPIADAATRVIDGLRATIESPPDAGADAEDLLAAGTFIADIVLSVITVVTLVFFWLIGHQRLQRFLLALLPARRRAGTRAAWDDIEHRLGQWVRGQLLLMATIFVLTTVAYFLIGLPNALLLGLIAGIAEMIPIVGPALGAIPALIVAAATGNVTTIILVVIVYVAIQLFEGNVLAPLVMKNTIGVPPFLVIVALTMGAAVGGVIGALLALPLTAAVVAILERAQARRIPVTLEASVDEPALLEDDERDHEDGASDPRRSLAVRPARPGIKGTSAAEAE
jgi:predicted PurR-regulated permease PerM